MLNQQLPFSVNNYLVSSELSMHCYNGVCKLYYSKFPHLYVYLEYIWQIVTRQTSSVG